MLKLLERTDLTAEEKLLMAIFGEPPERLPFCYPYIVIEENGEEKILKLAEAIEEALDTLPVTKSKKDIQPWRRHKKVIELRFGLKDGKARTLNEVAKAMELKWRESVRQIEARSLWMLRHPTRSRKLKKFFVPTPEEMATKDKKLEELRNRVSQLEEKNTRLLEILNYYGVKEEDFEETQKGPGSSRKDREGLKNLISWFPNTRVWHAVQRAQFTGEPITTLSRLRELVETGKIFHVRGIGQKAVEFLRQVLQRAEQEAPP